MDSWLQFHEPVDLVLEFECSRRKQGSFSGHTQAMNFLAQTWLWFFKSNIHSTNSDWSFCGGQWPFNLLRRHSKPFHNHWLMFAIMTPQISPFSVVILALRMHHSLLWIFLSMLDWCLRSWHSQYSVIIFCASHPLQLALDFFFRWITVSQNSHKNYARDQSHARSIINHFQAWDWHFSMNCLICFRNTIFSCKDFEFEQNM